MSNHQDNANAIRALAMDAVERANSGHPGMPMGMADIATVLWQNHLQHDPTNPDWPNRDRFVLSNGHGSMLLYALLHLTGYDLTVDDLKNFRQLQSKTPGHPEFGLTPGVETTTGPLGQGIAMAVGMAIGEKRLSAEFNQHDISLIDHFTYVFLGDGCLMEGISHEACSLAGTLKLGKLIAFWDDNGISIDGEVKGWFTDNTPERFKAYHWQVISGVDGHDPNAIDAAIKQAKANTDQPTLICCKTTIGFGSPKVAGTAKSHGAPLGQDEIVKTREQLGWPHAPFEIPESVYSAFDAKQQGQQRSQIWQDRFNVYEKQYPDLAKEFMRRLQTQLPTQLYASLDEFAAQLQTEAKAVATRKASQHCLNTFGSLLPELFGGSADLTGSNCTDWRDSTVFSHNNPTGNYISYGVREFAMTAIANGLRLYQSFIPYTGTFLTFSDYARNAVRLAALMQIQQILVYTHDSIGLGEDGPTHQPIEQAASLRLMPNLQVWRPADSVETAIAWQQSLGYQQGPSALLLSRQNLPVLPRDNEMMKNIQRGGYIVSNENSNKPIDYVLIATGSEVHLALTAKSILEAENDLNIRVVSMPCVDVFEKQSNDYQLGVLPESAKQRIVIEAGSSAAWYRYAGDRGVVIGIDRFGESAPASDVFNALGITVDAIVKTAQNNINREVTLL